MKILGVSAYYHDSAASIISDGEIIAAAQEERFTRIKHDPSFPKNAIKYCLEETGYSIEELDAVVFYDKPFLKFERLLETYYGFSPKGLMSFIRSIPVWVKEKLFLKRLIKKSLLEIESYDKSNLTLLFPEHHLSHAASAFYPSPFNDAAILTLDGVGEWATASISHGDGKKIKILKELNFPHSLGLLYSSFTYFLGFRVNSGEYKMMGLAPYGNLKSSNFHQYKEIITKDLVEIKEDGSIRLNQKFFSYPTGLRMVKDKKWEELFGFKRRDVEESIEQHHMDLALAIQNITEEVVLKMAMEAKRLTNSPNICLAGGVALNCVANGKLIDSGIFENVWIQPAAGDAGGSLGGALAAHHIYFDKDRKERDHDKMKGSYLGPSFHNDDVSKMARRFKAEYEHFDDTEQLCGTAAQLLKDNNVVGWFQGRMEFGPRALGHRSILGDARSNEMQQKLNLKIKYRESFRPFAPSVLIDDARQFFKLDSTSPYMLVVKDIAEEIKVDAPEDYNALELMAKLKVERSSIPAITHVDYSARIQTVDGEYNERYFRLIEKFKEKTGTGIVINTSFNVRGEPIVCTPEDAYRCFMRTEMDFLVINDFIFDKQKQPAWDNKDKWEEEFVLD